MNNMRGLLGDPLFNMGIGLLAERGQPRGLLAGLQLAQRANYQNALMKSMEQKQALAQQQAQKEADRQAALTRLTKEYTATPIPGSGPISQNPQPAYALNPMAEDMAVGAPDMTRAIMQKIMEAKMIPVPPKVTDDMAEYKLSQQDPAFAQYLKDINRAGASSTVVNTGNQILPTRDEILREDKLSRAKDARAFNKSVVETGYSARDNVIELDKALRLLETVDTGPFEETLLQATKIAGKLGLNVDFNKISNAEQLRVLFGDQVMARIGETKGAISEKEMDLFRTYSANYGNTPEGNRKILQFQKAKAERDIRLMKMVTGMREQDRTSSEIQKAVMDYVNNNDLSGMFTETKQDPLGLR